MSCTLTGKTRVLAVISSFVAILTVLAAVMNVAQVTDAGQRTAKQSVITVPHHAKLEGKQAVPAMLDGTNPLFLPAVTYGSHGIGAMSVAIADVNGDGKPDVVVANECAGISCVGNGSVGVLLGNANGTFHSAVTYDSGGISAFSISVADVNGDG